MMANDFTGPSLVGEKITGIISLIKKIRKRALFTLLKCTNRRSVAVHVDVTITLLASILFYKTL